MKMTDAVERRTLRKVYLRLLPFVLFAYFFLFFRPDQSGFCRAHHDEGSRLTATMFGFAAGAFF